MRGSIFRLLMENDVMLKRTHLLPACIVYIGASGIFLEIHKLSLDFSLVTLFSGFLFLY